MKTRAGLPVAMSSYVERNAESIAIAIAASGHRSAAIVAKVTAPRGLEELAYRSIAAAGGTGSGAQRRLNTEEGRKGELMVGSRSWRPQITFHLPDSPTSGKGDGEH